MNATILNDSAEALGVIRQAIRRAEAEAFEATVAERREAGAADPVLAAQNEWQGHDNGVVYGTFGEALADLLEFGTVPTGVRRFDPEVWDGGDTPANRREHLIGSLSRDGVVGDGEPLAYVGADGCFTLIRAGADRDGVEGGPLDCLPGDNK